MIPKKIHQIWFQGESELPQKYKNYRNSWVDKNDEYTFMLWDSQSIHDLIHKSGICWVTELYNGYTTMIQKIDFAKYLILYVYGGIYIDMDIECYKSLNTLHILDKHNLVLSKMPHDYLLNFLLVLQSPQLRLSDIVINNGIIFCSQGNQFMYNVMKECYKNRNFKSYNNTLEIFYTTGPMCLTNVYLQNKDSVFILDNKYFENCNINEIDNCELHPDSIGLHIYENSWITKNEKNLARLYKMINKIKILLLFLFVYLVFKFKKLRNYVSVLFIILVLTIMYNY